jgi:hypothetical protein
MLKTRLKWARVHKAKPTYRGVILSVHLWGRELGWVIVDSVDTLNVTDEQTDYTFEIRGWMK